MYDPAAKSGGIFADLIFAFIWQKITTSGFPSHVVSAERKLAFCREYESTLVVTFGPDEVTDDPGAGYAAKLLPMQHGEGTVLALKIPALIFIADS